MAAARQTLRAATWVATLGMLAGGGKLSAQADTAPPSAPAWTLRAAFAPAAAAAGMAPAIDWLRHHLLARRPEWPTDLSADAAFTVHVAAGTLRIGGALPLPDGIAVAGECDLGTGLVEFACGQDGSDDWIVHARAVPAPLQRVVDSLHLAIDGAPRTLDPAALLGNLGAAGGDCDPQAQQLLLGALQCAEVTVAVARRGGVLRARGRSGGGLCVPAALLLLALQRDTGAPPTDATAVMALRAFAGRDGDRAEAVRQLQRAGAEGLPALRALLHADESSRLAAIDALLRLGAAGELPRIVAAADADMPLATAMAATAATALWPQAAAATRTAAQRALRQNPALDADLFASGRPNAVAPAPPPSDPRWRWLAGLAVLASLLFTLLLRERHRVVPAFA